MSLSAGYSERVARLFREAPGAGRGEGEGWVSGEAGEPLTATRVRWHLSVRGGILREARYEVRGCPHTVAAAAVVAVGLKGRAIEGLDIDVEALARELAAPAAKRGRFFVIQDALRKALLQLKPGSA